MPCDSEKKERESAWQATNPSALLRLAPCQDKALSGRRTLAAQHQTIIASTRSSSHLPSLCASLRDKEQPTSIKVTSDSVTGSSKMDRLNSLFRQGGMGGSSAPPGAVSDFLLLEFML